MSKPIFFDAKRKRWKLLRLVTDPLGLLITLTVVFFIYTLYHGPAIGTTFVLPDAHRSLKTLKEKERPRRYPPVRHRKTTLPPSQVELNTDEGIRAAYYVPWDEGSYASFQENYAQIDLLFPEWLHVIAPDGKLHALAEGNKLLDVVQGTTVHGPDDKHPVMQYLREEKAQTEVFPLVNNFDPTTNLWMDISALLNDASDRANLRGNLLTFLASDKYRGLSLDFEEIAPEAQPGFNALVAELDTDLNARGMKLYVNLPPENNDYNYKELAAHSDGVIVMNYDQHVPGTVSGPVAAQDWFVRNLQAMLKLIPHEKIIVAIAGYGYDWKLRPGSKIPAPADVDTVSAQEAWLHAAESDSPIIFDQDSLNPHYGYLDENNVRHEVWYLDAVTALNQMRAARRLGINTFALWRLGAEDGALWSVWDTPRDPAAPQKLRSVPPGQDVDLEGKGEILRIEQTPKWGWREVTLDADSGMLVNESFTILPMPYQLAEYGGGGNSVAITFDDGPDPKFTPQILDVLRQKNATATFFLIGAQAEKFPDLTKRIYSEGHIIGNHTWSHPDVSSLSDSLMRLEVNSTERLFASKLGVKPLFFRPPYAIDEEPDTAAQTAPLVLIQSMGYITVGSKLDPKDWLTTPPRSAAQISDDVIQQLTQLAPGCLHAPCGNIVLLHDGGGDRSETVRSLPVMIDALRAHGYRVVSLTELLGKQRDDVMIPLSAPERWSARVDDVTFLLYGLLYQAIVLVFFLGNILMTSRLLLVGGLAFYDRFRRQPLLLSSPAQPTVAVLVPAFNEERVIVSTLRAVLNSEYPAEKLRVIMIDDGSSDNTLALARETFRAEIADGRLLVLTKPNAGKAEALNFGFQLVSEEVFVGIDADTVIDAKAVSRLVAHFRDDRVAAVAGNTKVGNRVNLWTRWQALEYITSQNFERRALNALGAVTVVPGALGAWRTAAVMAMGGFHLGTVAEDADLTMSLLEAGWRVVYEDRALAYTEAPINANGLMRQRFRWSFGIFQAVWKHRGAFKRKGVLGWVALPNIVIFQILLPMVSPAIDVMFVFGLISYFIDKHFHPVTANPASIEKLGLFFLIFLVTDFIASAIAFLLERREPGMREDFWLLSQVWLQRFTYRQVFSVVLFKTLKRAVDGRPFSWDKLERTAAPPPQAVASLPS